MCGPGAASAVLLAFLSACASGPSDGAGMGSPVAGNIQQGLLDYQEAGFLAGDADFPVVGRVVALRGPGDSAFVGLVASMSPAALEFARDGSLFAASYQVLAVVTSGRDTVRQVNRREVVRVDDFAETAVTEERVFFQHFIKLAPGTYDVEVTFRELSSRREGSRLFGVYIPVPSVPQFQLSVPLLAFRAVARQSYEQPPAAILAPRSSVDLGRPPLLLWAEDYSADPGELEVGVRDQDLLLWSRTTDPQAAPEGPATAIVPLPPRNLLPGRADLYVKRTGDGAVRSAPVLVALDDEWAFASFATAVDHLRYLVAPDSLEGWIDADGPERVRLWDEFWEATDTNPDTPENELLAEYFARMSAANRLYAEPGIPGWRTDRGRALVQLGEPDREVVQGGVEVGDRPEIEWVYEKALPFGVRLTFVDETDFGVFNLDQRSRLVLREAHRQLRRMQQSGELQPAAEP